MSKLIYKNKIILNEMKYLTSIFDISKGLMFAKKDKIEKGVCLVIQKKRDSRFKSSVTMIFCFYSMNILFVNSKFEIVDCINLKPWRLSYTPKSSAKYIIESSENKFKNMKIGDKVEIIV